MDRPALQRLLADIQSRLVDVAVVYKVDRLTRSLADFAKMVEVFDAQKVSFVSVTQQFNTTTSMGRLTLNVLLSFAQFEREVTGERIRDKIAASKRKGMWMGGWVPLGYDRKDRSLQINESEAEAVRTIFRLYVDLGNVRLSQAELERRKLTTKRYVTITGRQIGGLPFRRGHIYWILSNPLYIGEIGHKGDRHAGRHSAIIDRADWNAVQEKLAAKRHKHRVRSVSDSLLTGILFDEQGRRLTPTHTRKNGKLYRYYAVLPSHGRSAEKRKTLGLRISAAKIEQIVLDQLTAFLRDQKHVLESVDAPSLRTEQIKDILVRINELAKSIDAAAPAEIRSILVELVHRVIISPCAVQLELRRDTLLDQLEHDPATVEDENKTAEPVTIETAGSSARRGSETRLVLHDTTVQLIAHPIPLSSRQLPARTSGSRSLRAAASDLLPRLRSAKT